MSPKAINLIDAQNMQNFRIRVTGLNSNIWLLVFAENLINELIHLSINRGTIFLPSDKNAQRMITSKDYEIVLSPQSSKKEKILAFCIDALLAPPTDEHTFVATSHCHSEDLLKLVNYMESDMPIEIMQQAIWCISDNLTLEDYFNKFIRPRIIEALSTLSKVGHERPIRKSLKYTMQIPNKIQGLIKKDPWCEEPSYKDTIPGRKLNKLKDELEHPTLFTSLGISKIDLQFGHVLQGKSSQINKNIKIISAYRFLIQKLPVINSWFRQYPSFSENEKYVQIIWNEERKKAAQVQELLNAAGLSYSYI